MSIRGSVARASSSLRLCVHSGEMTRPGFDPTRRNRNIGTAAQGHGSDNRLVIPSPLAGWRSMCEELVAPCFVELEVAGQKRTFIVEKTRNDSVHVCTVDDIARMLTMIDAAHIDGLSVVVFRQPTRKQELLDPVWGRLQYFLEVGRHSGAAIILESSPKGRSRTRFSRSLTPDESAELERFREDGFPIVEDRRGFDVLLDMSGRRSTQLYRTVLHEVGHYLHYLEKVEWPSGRHAASDWTQLWDSYWQRGSKEREAFAHRYAERVGADLRDRGAIPFDRLDDVNRLLDLKLRPEDFEIAES